MAATEFSTLWAKLRRESGFKTPYEFFSRSGGRKVLQCSFVSYWKIEKGEILPKADRLPVLVARLRLSYDSPQISDLARAYLKTLLGSEQAYDWITRALKGPSTSPAKTVAQKALESAVWGDLHRITLPEFEAIVGDYASYWVFTVLCNDKGGLAPAALSKMLGLPAAAVAKAIKTLAARRLVKIAADGIARCPLVGKTCRYPPEEAMRQEQRDKIKSYHERMISARGFLVSHSYTMPRAAELEMGAFIPYLNNAVTHSAVYSVYDGPAPSAQFLIEGKIFRLFPF